MDLAHVYPVSKIKQVVNNAQEGWNGDNWETVTINFMKFIDWLFTVDMEARLYPYWLNNPFLMSFSG